MTESDHQARHRIAIITTGGTIGSVLANGLRSPDTRGAGISRRITRILDSVELTPVLVPALEKISEDMEPSDWVTIANHIKHCISQGIQHIVVTHGTDTLAYSVAAARVLLGDVAARVVFTGSIRGTDHPDSDVDLALRSAIEASCCENLAHGVYVSFRTPHDNNRAWLHDALALKSLAMDQAGFDSLYGDIRGEFSPDTGWSLKPRAKDGAASVRAFPSVPEPALIDAVGAQVRQVMAYPGQWLAMADADQSEPDVLIVSLYHSGTASTALHSQGLRRYIRQNRENTRVLLVGYPTRIVGSPYESIHTLVGEGALLYADIQPHVVYVTVVTGLALGLDIDHALQHLEHHRFHFERSRAQALP